ncbi:MAG: hypothetical protein J0I06_07465 [Planctomycetes bacterium]|nr:hypothetical protein [Planctomycetota bacterium]
MATDRPAEPKPDVRPWPWQFALLVPPLGTLAVFFVALFFRDPDLVGLLWRDPMGVKVTVIAVGGLVGGVFAYLGGCEVLNRRARVPWGAGAVFAQVALVVGWLVLFCLPAAYIVTVGPAAVQIQRNVRPG